MKNKNLDDINNKRVDTTKKRVAHAIRLIDNPVGNLIEGRIISKAVEDIAHAVNLLETASQEMKWACQYFDWNDDVCILIDDACAELGCCLAAILDTDDQNIDPIESGYNGKNALADLSKALATLVRWFDDSQDVAEI